MLFYALCAVGLGVLGLVPKVLFDDDLGWKGRAIRFMALVPIGAGLFGFGALNINRTSGRTLPAPEASTLFDGIRYERQVRSVGEPLVWHTVRASLENDGLAVEVTPGHPGRLLPLESRKTTTALHDFRWSVAINGGPFEPNGNEDVNLPPLFESAPVRPLGHSVAQGNVYGATSPGNTLWVGLGNKLAINEKPMSAQYAVSGDCTPVVKKAVGDLGGCLKSNARIARSFAGLADGGKTLVLLVVDGSQDAYSVGATAKELADLAIAAGVTDGIELGSGANSELAARGEDGKPYLLNVPVSGGLAGEERPVGNHLGITARARFASAL